MVTDALSIVEALFNDISYKALTKKGKEYQFFNTGTGLQLKHILFTNNEMSPVHRFNT